MRRRERIAGSSEATRSRLGHSLVTRRGEDHKQVEMSQDRSVMVTIRATVDPLVPDRVVVTLTRHPINPAGEPEAETTSSIQRACRQLERWLTEFAASEDNGTYR